MLDVGSGIAKVLIVDDDRISWRSAYQPGKRGIPTIGVYRVRKRWKRLAAPLSVWPFWMSGIAGYERYRDIQENPDHTSCGW